MANTSVHSATGFAREIVAVQHFCANPQCGRNGLLPCDHCYMLAYCSNNCRTEHRRDHDKDCKSPLFNRNWQPSWVLEKRLPTFVSESNEPGLTESFGTLKYLWGNTPAIDVIKLGANEGESYEEALCILFAASGDIRNLVMSIVHLPDDYESRVEVVVNDLDFDVVARNIILLLTFLVLNDPSEAAEYTLHLWYSAMVTNHCLTFLQTRLKPMIQEVCDKIAKKPRTTLLGKTWSFGSRGALRVVLTKEKWDALLGFLVVPAGLSQAKAHELRKKIVNAPERRDYVDRRLLTRPPNCRLGTAKFRSDGLLLPFGHPRAAHSVPNPTFFQTADKWPMMDSADPTDGWTLSTVTSVDAGPTRNDYYGKLHYYLLHLFKIFHKRLRSKSFHLEALQIDARLLPNHYPEKKFDRIDVSNVSDTSYVGLQSILKSLGPMLKSPLQNPHATLITLFLNAVPEMIHRSCSGHGGNGCYPGDDLEKYEAQSEELAHKLNKVMSFMPDLKFQSTTPRDPDFMRLLTARELVQDVDLHFENYMKVYDFTGVGIEAGVQIKADHTIIDPWPMRFGASEPTLAARKEFERLLASAHTGQERYVEWEVIREIMVEDVR